MKNLGFLFVCAVFLVALVWGEQPDTTSERESIEYALIVTGGELLTGVYADQHTSHITKSLGPLGLRCTHSIIVGDRPDVLEEALQFVGKRVKLIIVTGGLGPTADDITREALSKFTGISLLENPEVLKELQRRYSSSLLSRPNVMNQTRVPTNGGYLRNPNGTAVGLIFDKNEHIAIALPGPPRELRPMLKNELVPFLLKRYGIRSTGASLTMRFVGIGESAIDQVIDKLPELPKDLMISSLFETGRVDLTLSLPGDSDSGMEKLKTLEDSLLENIGAYMYSDDGSSLENHVVDLLREKNLTLTTAEVGTTGSLAAALSSVEGSRGVIAGGFVAADFERMAKILKISEPDLWLAERSRFESSEAIADLALKSTGSKWAVAAFQASQVESDNESIWIVVSSSKEVLARKMDPINTERRNNRDYLVTQILDLLRQTVSSSSK